MWHCTLYTTCHTRARIVNEWNELQQFFIGYLVNSISVMYGTKNSIIIFSYLFFLSCGVGSLKTRWAGCKLVCNHELVVLSQFAEAKRRNPTPNVVITLFSFVVLGLRTQHPMLSDLKFKNFILILFNIFILTINF